MPPTHLIPPGLVRPDLRPGEEWVFDYPRPPRLETVHRTIRVILGGVLIAETHQAHRVLETSHPPTYYLPRSAFLGEVLQPAAGSSLCEWKGRADYFDVVAGGTRAPRAAWSYPAPTPAFAALAGAVALYAGAMDQCTVDGAIVVPQPGGFYGGWITPGIIGPFKGGPGTMGW